MFVVDGPKTLKPRQSALMFVGVVTLLVNTSHRGYNSHNPRNCIS